MSQHNIGRIFLSTPSARRATIDEYKAHKKAEISIHALREEGDREIQTDRAWRANFYPRPPRGGRRAKSRWPAVSTRISIHALREEGDARRSGDVCDAGYFYPRPPRGGRPLPSTVAMPWELFLSTPSARRATHAGVLRVLLQQISIHALREEGDVTAWRQIPAPKTFLSTPSARRATKDVLDFLLSLVFLSTPSARRATYLQ